MVPRFRTLPERNKVGLVAADTEALCQRLQLGAAELGLAIDAEQGRQLMTYLSALLRWNSVHSLSARTDPDEMLVNDVMDSLTLVGPLDRFAEGRPLGVLDAGSGPGFPSAVLAAMRAGWSVTAADAVSKKIAFVRQAAAEAGIVNLMAWHGRLEALRPPVPFDVVVARALGSLAALVRWTDGALKRDGIWIAQKGRYPDREVTQLQGVEVFHVEPVTVPGLDAQRHLIWMRRCTT